MYVLLYHVIAYRKDVVYENLKKSFPEKSEDEIKLISKKYYKHLCDLFVETFKILTISKRSLLKRCPLDESAKKVFDQLTETKSNCILVLGHQGNFEWAGHTMNMKCQQKLHVIYHPLSNKHFDGLMLKMRTRTGTKMIPMKDTFREMVALKSELNITTFLADQTPAPEFAYWTTFLNQDTPVFQGTEKIAKKLDYPVVYGLIKKEKRGYYKLHASMLVENPKSTQPGEITECFTRKLEEDIREQPETWLWSHRRWKHKRKV